MWRAEDHTADACLYVEAASWVALLEEAVRAFAEWTSANAVPADARTEARALTLAKGESAEAWVRYWRALHRLWVVERVLPVAARVEGAHAELRCLPAGELDTSTLADVKAVTWHGAEVGRKNDGGWYGRIVLDI